MRRNLSTLHRWVHQTILHWQTNRRRIDASMPRTVPESRDPYSLEMHRISAQFCVSRLLCHIDMLSSRRQNTLPWRRVRRCRNHINCARKSNAQHRHRYNRIRDILPSTRRMHRRECVRTPYMDREILSIQGVSNDCHLIYPPLHCRLWHRTATVCAADYLAIVRSNIARANCRPYIERPNRL